MVDTFTLNETDVEEVSLQETENSSQQWNEPSMESIFLIKQFAHSYSSESVDSMTWSVSLN